jgi:DNA-binding GntR family transcriptional regulator
MKLNKIESKTLRQKVYELLKEKIITAEILPGQKISLRNLAEMLDVSLMPVREALWQLESEKVVIIQSNRHMRVNNLTTQEMKEAYRIRLNLETMAAKMACDHRSDSDLSKVKRILLELDKSIKEPKQYLKINRRFHFEIYTLSKSPMLINIIDGLWARVGPYFYLHTTERRDLSVPMKFHKAMFEALIERDKQKMTRAIGGDLKTASGDILHYIETLHKKYDNYSPEEITDFSQINTKKSLRRADSVKELGHAG